MAIETGFESKLGSWSVKSLAAGGLTEYAGLSFGALLIQAGALFGIGWVGLRYFNPWRKSPQTV